MPIDHRPGVRRLFSLGLRRPRDVRAAMDEELRFHLDARVEYLVARGVPPDEARAEARRRAGLTTDHAHERLHRSAERKERRMAMREMTHDLWQDFRYAARGLAQRPAFTAVAIVTLAAGIGANTAIFSAVNAMLLRPLPFREPDRLIEVTQMGPGPGAGPVARPAPWSWPKFAIYRDAQRSFADVALWGAQPFNLTDGDAERVDGEMVSARYLATLAVRPVAGRDFPATLDAAPNAERVTLISDALWRRRFNADPAVIGRTIAVDGAPWEVIGVLPPTFRGLSGKADLLVPLTTRPADQLAEPWSLEFSLIARLNTGVSTPQAAREAESLGKRVYELTPMQQMAGPGATAAWGAAARPLDETRVSPTIRRSLLVLFGAVGFVLLIACVNLANLLLGRANARRREIAIRLAIGAGRTRLVRLFLAESVLLSVLGGTAGLLVAWWGTRALSAVNPESTLQAQGLAALGVVSFEAIRLDVPALVFTLLVAIAVGILFGLVPALQATRPGVQQQLKDGDAVPLATGRLRAVNSRRVLVVAEVALAIVLLAGAGLMLKSLRQLLRIDSGFDASGLLTLRLNISPTEVPRDSMPGFYDQLLTRLHAIPGVTRAALGDCPPLNGGCNLTMITHPDRPAVALSEAPEIGVHVVTTGWFEALKVPLKRGRLFNDADRLGAPRVMVISEMAARRYWPNEDPLGKRAAVYQGGFHDGATVVGIVGDVRYATIDSLPRPDAYVSYGQAPRSRMMIFLRTNGDPEAVAAPARSAIRELSPSYPAYDVQTMAARTAVATAQARLSALLLALFAATALTLAVVGLYGVMSFMVAQRTREIGIRMALGAERGDVLRMILGEGVRLSVIGAALGVSAALALSRLLWSLLYEVSPNDPLTYVAIVALLTGAAAAASWLPARRATRVDPTEALRAG